MAAGFAKKECVDCIVSAGASDFASRSTLATPDWVKNSSESVDDDCKRSLSAEPLETELTFPAAPQTG